jgi:hypothetical protein
MHLITIHPLSIDHLASYVPSLDYPVQIRVSATLPLLEVTEMWAA